MKYSIGQIVKFKCDKASDGSGFSMNPNSKNIETGIIVGCLHSRENSLYDVAFYPSMEASVGIFESQLSPTSDSLNLEWVKNFFKLLFRKNPHRISMKEKLNELHSHAFNVNDYVAFDKDSYKNFLSKKNQRLTANKLSAVNFGQGKITAIEGNTCIISAFYLNENNQEIFTETFSEIPLDAIMFHPNHFKLNKI